MKIVHVREVANVAHGLVRGLQELGYQAELIEPHENADPRIVRKMFLAPRRIMRAIEINRRIRRHGFDVVHLHYANSGWMGALGGYRYALHCHGSDVRVDLYHPIRKWLVRDSLQRAGLVFFSTPDLHPHVAALRPDAIFTPNPIDADRFHATSSGTTDRVRLLINVALKASKAPEVAFDAAREIKHRCPDVEICAIAYGPLLPKFECYEQVRFLAPVPHADMGRLIGTFDVVLGQFQIGSLGMSELESMACGKPVVCFLDADLYGRWYEQMPPVAIASDARSTAEAAIELIRDRARRQDLGHRGREWVVRHHHYRNVAAELARHYHAFLGEVS